MYEGALLHYRKNERERREKERERERVREKERAYDIDDALTL